MNGILQPLLLVAALGLVALVLSKHGTQTGSAWRKLGMLILAIVMVIAVISPQLVDDAAHAVGVGRGTDLLLYLTVVAFIFFAITSYLHRQQDQNTIHKLARKIAIMEAQQKYKNKAK